MELKNIAAVVDESSPQESLKATYFLYVPASSPRRQKTR
jgi:hypothetical protein